MARNLECPASLQEAVRKVISDNKATGYNPIRFIQITGNGDNPELLSMCQQLLRSDTAFEAMDNALQKHGSLLTIEDFVLRWSSQLGFDDEDLGIAMARCEAFDKIVGFRRYE